MARNRKSNLELLMPGASGWCLWSGQENSGCTLDTGSVQGTGAFSRDAQRRVLALPASHVWVLPAWLHGQPEHLRDMALLHLERLGVRVADPEHSLQVLILQEKDGAYLTTIIALKETPAQAWDGQRLPDEVCISARCRPLPADSIILQREMGRLTVTITHGAEIVYASPLSAHHLDDRALGELNHLCVQLGFQRVLGRVEGIVLWLDEEGDLGQIERITGLSARREQAPPPVLRSSRISTLQPAEILAARRREEARARTRVTALGAGIALAACIAVMMVLISSAARERDLLRDRVAELTPRASQALDQKKAWIEAAPAVDPGLGPMQVLLDIMQPSASTEVGMTSFEWTPGSLALRGRTPDVSLALQYMQEIKGVEALSRYAFETPDPQIASDNSATFEVKGERRP
ncbi:MAG: hypothetical protein CJBNEKGG_00484 [Prosthecobacter sp.]|nr:hypothetical protein [Prosthecobacter sp.]